MTLFLLVMHCLATTDLLPVLENIQSINARCHFLNYEHDHYRKVSVSEVLQMEVRHSDTGGNKIYLLSSYHTYLMVIDLLLICLFAAMHVC